MKSLKKMLFAITIATILPLLAACGNGGGGNATPNPPNNGQVLYSVGGTVIGLNDNVTLVLQNNGNTRTINGNGSSPLSFTFSTSLANGAPYSVSVLTQPQGQTCVVQNGSGTIQSVNVTVQVVCANNTGGVTLSGKIKVPDGVVLDGSVNDCNEDYIPNGTFDTAQELPNPISVGGYVNRRGRGDSRGCSYSSGNQYDYYLVQLKAGDIITLAIGESNTRNNNLYLYLCGYDDSDPCVLSPGTGTYRILTAPSDDIYYVAVYAYSGASNYILTIGADMDTAALAYADTGVLSTQSEMVPGQVIVRFKDTVKTAESSNQAVTQYAANMGLTAVAGSPEREMLFSIDDTKFQIYANNIYANNTDGAYPKLHERVTAGDPEKTRLLNTLVAIMELREQPDILFAEPNYIRTNSKIPDDKYYGGYQWNLPMIGLPEAWDETTGSDDVIVAVVDSGALMNHPDLSGRLTNTGYKFLNSGTDIGADPSDPGGKESQTSGSSFHGTHVAGIIAAKTNNNDGVAGITWNTKIMPVRVIGAGGSGTVYDMIQGISYAAGLSNASGIILPEASRADIINLSLGGTGKSDIEQELFNTVRERGIIVVAAAGNENRSTPSYPASYEGVISVSAVNINGTRASYSNYGSNIDVAAPGGDSGDYNGDGNQDYILSTGGDDTSGSIKYDVYTLKAGTSMAAPHVAGVAALMKSVYKDLTADEFKLLLDAGDITEKTGYENKTYYGNGLINAYKAVAAASKLAGGEEISGLDVNPRTVNFGATSPDWPVSDRSVTVSKIGTGALSITEKTSNASWLTVTPGLNVDGNGLGSYNLHVDASSLTQEGAYTAIVTFTASNGKTVSVSVTVQVRGETKVTYDAGVHYVLLYRINDDGASELVDVYEYSNGYLYGVKASGGYYEYKFTDVPPGNYMIIAGSDRNKNFLVGDGGEALGAYPTLEQIVSIEVANSNIPNLDFTTNLILSISSTTMAFNDMGMFDKPAAILPEFKRFLNIEELLRKKCRNIP